jgi:hypothetical protein
VISDSLAARDVEVSQTRKSGRYGDKAVIREVDTTLEAEGGDAGASRR